MFNGIEFLENVNLKSYSTIKIGGIAKYMVFPKNHLEILKIVDICEKNNIKYYVIGNGSDILFDDEGYDGVVINLKYFDKIKFQDKTIRVGAGTKLFALNRFCKQHGLSGLEWSYGIPATLGGALVMNCGCFGFEIGDYVLDVVILKNGKIRKLSKEEIGFAYRTSNLKNCIILSANLKLKQEKPQIIEEKMNFYIKKKQESQPCDKYSLGSVFKQIRNGEEIIYPAKLIDKLGLKGVKIGDVEVSSKHAGFIVSNGNGKSKDFLNLVALLKLKLQEIGVYADTEIIHLKD